MPDPTILNALAAVLTATGGVIAAVTGLVRVLRRGQRTKDESDHSAP